MPDHKQFLKQVSQLNKKASSAYSTSSYKYDPRTGKYVSNSIIKNPQPNMRYQQDRELASGGIQADM
jgi:hypothetical protein